MQKTISPIPNLFTVETPPYIHCGRTIQTMTRDMLIALAPAMVMATVAFGIPALRVMALASGTAVLAEFITLRLQGKECRIYDGTALVSGLLFAFLLPAGAPWWLVVVGSALSIIIGKQVFGGLGANPICVPLVGWALLTISWPTFMDANAMNLSSTLMDPLFKLNNYGPDSLPSGIEPALLLGKQLGGLGTVHIAAIILGGVFLCVRGTIRWEVPVAFIATVLVVGSIYWFLDSTEHIAPHLYLLTGSSMFLAFFLATDHASTPVSSTGLFIFGCLAGTLLVFMRVYGIYPDGAPFAIMLANLCTPLIDMIKPKPWGRRG